jgi:hypothetical protein
MKFLHHQKEGIKGLKKSPSFPPTKNEGKNELFNNEKI